MCSSLRMKSTERCRATRCLSSWSRPAPTAGAWAALRAYWSDEILPSSASFTTPVAIGIGHKRRHPFRRAHDAAHPHSSWAGNAVARKTPRLIGCSARKPPSAVHDDLEGLVVDVEITSWPTPFKPPVGRVIEVLGDPDDFGVDVEMMIRKHQLPRVFPDNVLAEARAVAHLDPSEVERREDFRELPIVTIDGETARDFDDAVLVTERPDGGYQLQVHIADVAEYVRAATDLDLEARLRGTSVYFPDRAIPMLPQELSTNICSLRPGEDRLVLSCIMQLSPEGRIESYEIVEGVIRSAARMTYTEVHAILEGNDGNALALRKPCSGLRAYAQACRADEYAARRARQHRF